MSNFSGSKLKRNFASISSKHLFIRVAESIVILSPIFHVGCLRASTAFLFFICSRFCPKKGPPEAVMKIFFISFLFRLLRDEKSEKCSESIGISSVPDEETLSIINLPKTTNDSLFASKSFFPDFAAAIVSSRAS